MQQRIVTDLVDDALQNGAHAAAGGRPHDGEGFFYRPTILSNLDDGTRIVAEEQFGPALPVRPPEVTAFLAARTERLRFRGDQAMATQCAGQPPDQRGEHSPVRPVQVRPRVGRRRTATSCRSTRSSTSLMEDVRPETPRGNCVEADDSGDATTPLS